MAACLAYAAGVTGIFANLSLIVMYVLLGLQDGSPEAQTLVGSAFHVAGSASDLLSSLATAFMIPVALFLGGTCRDDGQHALYRRPGLRP